MKPPRLVNDLYRDLRDRRLLPLAAVLLIAIPALPLLLGSGGGDPAATMPPAETGIATEEIPTLPAVLTSTPGLRDYRKRLDALSSKNPFAQQFDGSTEETQAASVTQVQGVGGTGSGPVAAPPVGGGAAAPAAEPSSTPTSATVSGTTTSSDTSQAGTVSGGDTTSTDDGGGGTSGQGSSSPGGRRWFTYRIDVTTGPAGGAKERSNVKRLTVLPSQSNPVALFVGASEGGKKASFLVSTDVSGSRGQGDCVPRPSDCRLLVLEPGQERKFDYAPDGEPDTYVIKLDTIRIVPIDGPKAGGAGSAGDDSKSANAGLKAFLGL